MLLAIESSGVGYSVALAAAPDHPLTLVVGAHEAGPSAARLLAAIDFALADAGAARADLAAVAVGIGPGGFTGLRVGLTIAKTLAAALAIPLLAVPTLAAHALFHLEGAAGPAAGAGDDEAPLTVAVTVDARRRQVYGGVWRLPAAFDVGGNAGAPTGAVAVRAPAAGDPAAVLLARRLRRAEALVPEVCEELGAFARRLAEPALLASPGARPRAAAHRALWCAAPALHPCLVPPSPAWRVVGRAGGVVPTAIEVARLALADDDDAPLRVDPAAAEPRYVRGADAKLPGVPQPT